MSPPPQPDQLDTSLHEEIEYTVQHPYFPLIFRKGLDICGSNALEHPDLMNHFSIVENEASRWQHFAEIHGPIAAEKQWNSISMLMFTMIAALNRVAAVGCAGHLPLQDTIATCRKALSNTGTDPRFVSPNEDHRVQEIQCLEPISQVEGLQVKLSQQSHSISQRDDPIRRSDGIHGSSGIRKPLYAARRSLSEKARNALERWFQEHVENPYPTTKEKEELAASCAVSLTSVNNWFSNKRMRIKRKMLQVGTPGSENISDTVLAPKSKWNAVVVKKMTSQEGREVLSSATGRTVSPDIAGVVKDRQKCQQRERVGPSCPNRPEITQQ